MQIVDDHHYDVRTFSVQFSDFSGQNLRKTIKRKCAILGYLQRPNSKQRGNVANVDKMQPHALACINMQNFLHGFFLFPLAFLFLLLAKFITFAPHFVATKSTDKLTLWNWKQKQPKQTPSAWWAHKCLVPRRHCESQNINENRYGCVRAWEMKYNCRNLVFSTCIRLLLFSFYYLFCFGVYICMVYAASARANVEGWMESRTEWKEWKEETERKIINKERKKNCMVRFETETKMKQVAIHIII